MNQFGAFQNQASGQNQFYPRYFQQVPVKRTPPIPVPRPSDPTVSTYSKLPDSQAIIQNDPSLLVDSEKFKRKVERDQYVDISNLVRSDREIENSEPQYSDIPVVPRNSIKKRNFQKTTGVSLVSSENKTRRILEALIIVFCLLTFGFLVLYFLYGSNASASEAARIGFTAGAIIFTVASTISAILLVWYAKKTCGANQT